MPVHLGLALGFFHIRETEGDRECVRYSCKVQLGEAITDMDLAHFQAQTKTDAYSSGLSPMTNSWRRR